MQQILNGTEKQVVWAEQIRSRLLSEVDAYFARLAAEEDEEAEEDGRAADYTLLGYAPAEIRAAMAAETSAVWWIDHRGHGPRFLSDWVLHRLPERPL